MNILLESRSFYPSVGGLEMMGEELARMWQQRGHAVRVVSSTPLDGAEEIDDLTVHREPSASCWLSMMRWADVFFQNGVSLRSIGYAIATRCPVVFRHPDILRPIGDSVEVRNELKRIVTLLGENVASCKPVAEPILGPTTIVPNTYRKVFRGPLDRGEERSGLLFVGRLVSFKGVDVALNALAKLHERGTPKHLTICGDGPDRSKLERQADQLGLTGAVHFEGWTAPEDLVDYYAAAELTLIPSRYEPFGIVALEAIACGSPVVAAQTGGLPEAVGPCGILVPSDEPGALAKAIEQALNPEVRNQLMQHASEHIARHQIDHIADQYLDVLHKAADQ